MHCIFMGTLKINIFKVLFCEVPNFFQSMLTAMLSLSFSFFLSHGKPPPLAEYSMWPIKAEEEDVGTEFHPFVRFGRHDLSTLDPKLLIELRPWPAQDISTKLFFRVTFAAFRAKTASYQTRASTPLLYSIAQVSALATFATICTMPLVK